MTAGWPLRAAGSHLWPRAEDRTRNAAAQMLTEALTADQVRIQRQ